MIYVERIYSGGSESDIRAEMPLTGLVYGKGLLRQSILDSCDECWFESSPFE